MPRSPWPVITGFALAAALSIPVDAAGAAEGAAAEVAAPAISSREVRPSSCPEGEDVLVYTRRPRFEARADSFVPGSRVRFEVYPYAATEYPERRWAKEEIRTVGAGTVTATRAGGHLSATWRSDRLPWGDQLVWRVRTEAAGRAAGAWSPWRTITVDTSVQRVHECGATGADLQDVSSYAGDHGLTLRQALDDENWLGDFYDLADQMKKRFPDEFNTAEPYVGAENRRGGWFAFRGRVPPGVDAMVADLRRDAEETGDRVHLLADRTYTERMIRRRQNRFCDLVFNDPATGSGWCSIRMSSGTVELFVGKAEGVTESNRQMARRLLRLVQEHSRLTVVAWHPGAVATARIAPVLIKVGGYAVVPLAGSERPG